MIEGVWWSDDNKNELITADQIALWWAEDPTEEVLEAKILAYIQSQHSYPPEKVGFVLYEYSPPDRINYNFIYGDFPADWWVR